MTAGGGGAVRALNPRFGGGLSVSLWAVRVTGTSPFYPTEPSHPEPLGPQAGSRPL